MITLNINGRKYPVPDFSIDQWTELQRWDIELEWNWARIIHIATGAPLDLIREATPEQLHLGAVLVADGLITRKEVVGWDPSQAQFGQFVDMETYISWGIAKTMKQCLQTLKIETDSAAEALWVIEKWIEWRGHIYREYKGLFSNDDLDEEDVEKQFKKDPNSVPRAWYRIMVNLAGGDVLKLDQVAEQPVKKILNFMALQKQDRMEEEHRLLKQKREYELQANRRQF